MKLLLWTQSKTNKLMYKAKNIILLFKLFKIFKTINYKVNLISAQWMILIHQVTFHHLKTRPVKLILNKSSCLKSSNMNRLLLQTCLLKLRLFQKRSNIRSVKFKSKFKNTKNINMPINNKKIPINNTNILNNNIKIRLNKKNLNNSNPKRYKRL